MKTLLFSVIAIVAVSITFGILIISGTIDVSSILKSQNKPQVVPPSAEISVSGLNDTYLVGSPINFNITTTSNECSWPKATLAGINGTIVWSSRNDVMFCDTLSSWYPIWHWRFDNGSLGTLVVNRPGNYVITISLLGTSIEKQFSVILPQRVANKFVDIMDFHANLPLQINASRGETLTIPVDIYGSSNPRGVDIVISKADRHRGVVDMSNSTLPQGFSITIPVKHIEMKAMDEKTLEKPLMTVNMTISISDAVKPGTYGFAINMLSHSPQGNPDGNSRAFYIDVR